MSVSYRVSIANAHAHLFEVTAQFPPVTGDLVAALPVWTPGSYLVREYSRHIQELRVTDTENRPLPFERLDKRSLKVSANGQAVRLTYKVYANELTVRTSHLDGSHGYFNGATLFYYVESLREKPHAVTVETPAGWRVSVALERQGDAFVAPNYDELIDAPFELGPHQPITFTAANVPHDVVMWGDPQLDEKKLVNDLQKIIDTEAAMMGPLPFKRYTFFIYGSDKLRGGLEHKASTALVFPRAGFSSAKGWEDFLTLCAHEYFHLWNVKRIKPKRLVPFDYAQENYTQLLWWFEGGTSYYDNMLVRRAGLMTGSRYLTRLGESVSALHQTPGRTVMSLVDASWLSWTKHYRPDENTQNTAISYYLKGEIVCALLDLHIRKATANAKSLDDVMRLLWARYGDERGVPEDGIEAAASEVAGTSLKAFFDQALRTTSELDYSIFNWVGLELRVRARESSADKGGTPPKGRTEKAGGYLGVQLRGSATVASVLDGTPAMQAGLYADDEIVALDGTRCDGAQLISRCDDKKPGDQVRLTVFRRDRLLEIPVTLGARPAECAWLARVDKPTEAQKAAFASWLQTPYDEPAP